MKRKAGTISTPAINEQRVITLTGRLVATWGCPGGDVAIEVRVGAEDVVELGGGG